MPTVKEVMCSVKRIEILADTFEETSSRESFVANEPEDKREEIKQYWKGKVDGMRFAVKLLQSLTR